MSFFFPPPAFIGQPCFFCLRLLYPYYGLSPGFGLTALAVGISTGHTLLLSQAALPVGSPTGHTLPPTWPMGGSGRTGRAGGRAGVRAALAIRRQ